jgi:hypothetical protein
MWSPMKCYTCVICHSEILTLYYNICGQDQGLPSGLGPVRTSTRAFVTARDFHPVGKARTLSL